MFACLYSPSTPRAVLERIARDFSPRIEVPRESLVLLDISGLDRLLGEPRVIGEELQHALVMQGVRPADTTGLKPCATSTSAPTAEPHVAIAGTRVAAELLARTIPSLTVIELGAEAAALAPLPLCSLTHLGAPPDLLTTLEGWGLRTLGEFGALPSKRLASRIGQHGLVWQRMARGEDARPLVPALPEERFEEMLDLEWPIEGLEPLAFVLGTLLGPLCARLELRDRAVAAIELRLRFVVSRRWQTRRLELPAPMRDPRMLRTLLCLDLEGHPDVLNGPAGAVDPGQSGGAGESIDRVGLFVEPTPGRVAQFSLLARPSIAPEAVATLMARLRALMGQDRCGIARLVDTYRPGAFVMADFDVVRPNVAVAGPIVSSGARPPTPDLKLGPTNGPAQSPHAVRRLRHPIPARVAVERGRPVRVTTDRRGWSGGRVTWCAGPWRAAGDWWKHDVLAYDYQEWDVALTDGGRYRIHEDRPRAQWFVDAILD